MKKFISIIVMTAMLCSFVSCENNTADESESSVTSVAEISEEETTEEEMEEESTEEITETESGNEISENIFDYKEALEKFLEYTNSNDIENITKITYPDKYIDSMKIMAENSGYSIKELINYENESDETVRLAEIISEESANEGECEAFHIYYGLLQLAKNYLDENGANNFDEWIDNVNVSSMEDIPETYFHADDIRIVNCLLEYTDSDGDSYTEERKFMVYYIDGEGWKIDIAISGYEKESKQQTLNSVAITFAKASNTAIVELDEMGIEYPEKCIICSDKSKNYNVTDDFVSQFDEEIEIFFSDYKEYDYIIVFNDGVCVYVACTYPENPKYVGTYPENKLYSAEEVYTDMDEEYTFDEIYNICLEEFKK